MPTPKMRGASAPKKATTSMGGKFGKGSKPTAQTGGKFGRSPNVAKPMANVAQTTFKRRGRSIMGK